MRRTVAAIRRTSALRTANVRSACFELFIQAQHLRVERVARRRVVVLVRHVTVACRGGADTVVRSVGVTTPAKLRPARQAACATAVMFDLHAAIIAGRHSVDALHGVVAACIDLTSGGAASYENVGKELRHGTLSSAS